MRAVLITNPHLQRASRFTAIDLGRSLALDTAVLITCGSLAMVAITAVSLNVSIPGNAILRGILPFATGLALVPRYGSGCLVSCSAVITAIAIGLAGWGRVSLPAVLSIAMLGPALDGTLARFNRGPQLYISFLCVATAVNLLGFLARAGTAWLAVDPLNSRPFLTFWFPALISYLACGAIAGLVSAMICFRRGDITDAMDRT